MRPQSGRQTPQTSQCGINTAQSLRFASSEQIVMPKASRTQRRKGELVGLGDRPVQGPLLQSRTYQLLLKRNSGLFDMALSPVIHSR